ncbi:MAG: MATE family efflux transporter [Myxococcota bacterium]
MNVNSPPIPEAEPVALPRGPGVLEGAPMIALAMAAIGLVWFLNAIQVLEDAPALAFSLGLAVVGVGMGFRQQWLDVPVAGKVVRLGVPVIFAMLSQTAVNVVDTAFVGRLPAAVALPGVAAIGISLPIFWLVGGFLSAIGIGTQALTARRHGEGDDEAAGRVLMSSGALAAVLGISFSILGYLVLPLALPFFNSDPTVVEQGLPFARIRYIGISSMVITTAFKAFFDGTGRTHVHLVAAIVMNVINILLCYGLIFGELGMPRLEVAGAAWASTISSAIGTLVMVGWSFLPSLRSRYRLYTPGSFSPAVASSILRISLPSGGATVIGMLGFLMFHKAVAAVDHADGSGLPLNASATAVIQQIVMLVFLLSFAFATATATLVSQSLGAKKTELAASYAWQSAKLGTLVMAAVASVLFMFPDVALEAFIKSDALGEQGKQLAIAAGVGPLRLIAVASVAITAAVVFTQSLYGAGNTKFVMVVEGVLHLFCLVPLAWLLGVYFRGGLLGVWSAAGLYVVLLATIMGAKFAEGRWKSIRL